MKKIFFSFFLIVSVLSLTFFVSSAGEDDAFRGVAHSVNIGDISFNNTEDGSSVSYGVTVSSYTGNATLSGRAWNDNIGWISFDVSNTACPAGSNCTPRLNWATGNLSGYAEVLSMTDGSSGDGYGWIELSGDWTNPVRIDTNSRALSGYAWGGDIIGWIDFDGVFVFGGDATIVSLSANPNPVSPDTGTRLSWTTQNATTCTASGDWSGERPVNGFEDTGALSSAKTYTLRCTGPGGEQTGSVTVEVSDNPACSDGIDNDGDGDIDFPEDTGCSSPTDTVENPPTVCSDGIDNDGDGAADYPEDLGCISPEGTTEVEEPNYSLSKTRDISITLVGRPLETSNETRIRVNPNSTFESPVSFTVANEQDGWIYSFVPETLTQDGYSGGARFFVSVPNTVASGEYIIRVQGEGGGIVREVPVTFTVSNINPEFEEF